MTKSAKTNKVNNMDNLKFMFKPATLAKVCFPQLPSFCGIASCLCVCNALLGSHLSQQDMHRQYGVGALTKLPLKVDSPLDNLETMSRDGMGLSNWDVIRLFNTICLDAGATPASALLCGLDFIREAGEGPNDALLRWFSKDCNQAIIHIKNHYMVCAGIIESAITHQYSLIAANSSRNYGPCSSFGWQELQKLAQSDSRYGLILMSLEPLPRTLFDQWSQTMLPLESTDFMRFTARIPTHIAPMTADLSQA